MRGRERFRRWSWLLRLCVHICRGLPRGFAEWGWAGVAWVPGPVGAGLRYVLAARLARQVGTVVLFGPQVEVAGWDQLMIGSNVSIHRGCYVDATGGLSIGDDVSIAHACSILTSEHTWDDPTRPIRDNPLRLAPVRIESDVWLGCGVRLLAGVTVHSRSVLAAGAVVTRDVPPRTVVGGVPARPLRTI